MGNAAGNGKKEKTNQIQIVIDNGSTNDELDLSCQDIDDDLIPFIYEQMYRVGNNVKVLNLQTNSISSYGASLIFDAMKKTKSSIEILKLNGNSINDNSLSLLGDHVKATNVMIEIHLSSNDITDNGIEILCPYLMGNNRLRVLDLSWNPKISEKSTSSLLKLVESSLLDTLSIEGTSIQNKNILISRLVANKLRNGSKNIFIPLRNINDENVKDICEAIKKHGFSNILELNLYSNKITSEGATLLFNTLKTCTNYLKHLDVCGNMLDDKCLAPLSSYIKSNNSIEYLSIGKNEISDEGIYQLYNSIIGNTSLRKLDLSLNKGITDKSADVLNDMATSSCLVEVDINGTSINHENRFRIKQSLEIIPDKRDIPIISNTKSAAKSR